MIFPAQTSFIPITVAVTKWVEANGFGGNYPYWYLGTTPVKYLMGPVVPGILVLLHKVLPNLNFFDLSFLLLIASYLLQAIGWGFLAFQLSKNRSVGYLVGVLSLVLPFTIFYSFAFGEVSSVFASALTPWVLVAYAKVESGKWKVESLPIEAKIFNFQISIFKLLVPACFFAFLLLVNSTAAVPAVVGLVILSISNFKFPPFEKSSEGERISNLRKAAIVIVAGWLIATLWYGPGYWLTVWGAPSFGGRSAAFSLVWVFNLFRGFAPFFLALAVIFWRVKKRSIFEKFALSWFLGFGFLTLVRFVANPAFWLDWTAWIREIEIGIVLLVAGNFQFLISNFKSNLKFKFSNIKNSLKISNLKFQISMKSIIYLLFTIYLVGAWVLAWQKRDLWLPRGEISQSVEYKVASELNKRVKPEERVFLSGTSAFWLNSFYDILQVRGGRDEVSQYRGWREAVWEIRNGTSGEESLAALRGLGVRFLVVHTDKSQEYYHDFSDVEKFEGNDAFKKIYENNGDVIYSIN